MRLLIIPRTSVKLALISVNKRTSSLIKRKKAVVLELSGNNFSQGLLPPLPTVVVKGTDTVPFCNIH